MNGYQISFFTQLDRRHHGKPLGEWLMHLARELGLHGATLQTASEGFGRSGRIHRAHFVELTDSPVEVVIVVTPEEGERLFARLHAEEVELFYVKIPVEFGSFTRAQKSP